MINLNNFKYQFLGKYPLRYKVFIRNTINEPLFQYLELHGFFDFHTTNHGFIVSFHQIVAFFKCGGLHALKLGLTCSKHFYEIHHINGNTFDNHKSNLIYVPKILHYELSKCQRRLNKYFTVLSKRICYTLLDSLSSIPIWNKHGKLIFNKSRFCIHILFKTMYQSWLFFKPPHIYFSSKNLKLWLSKTIKNLKTYTPIGMNIHLLFPSIN